MTGKETACFLGAEQCSLGAWSPSYNYTSVSPSFASNVQIAWSPSVSPSFASNEQVAWSPRQAELSYTSAMLNQRKPMVTNPTSPWLANKSLVSRKSSLSTTGPKSDDNNDDDSDCADGNNTDYDEEDGDDESKPQITRSKDEEWNNILVIGFALVIGYLLCSFLLALQKI